MKHEMFNDIAREFLESGDRIRAIQTLLIVEKAKRDTSIIKRLSSEKHDLSKDNGNSHRFKAIVTVIAAMSLLPLKQKDAELKKYFNRLISHAYTVEKDMPLFKGMFVITNFFEEKDQQKYQKKIFSKWPNYPFSDIADFQKCMSPENHISSIKIDFRRALENKQPEMALYSALLSPQHEKEKWIMLI